MPDSFLDEARRWLDEKGEQLRAWVKSLARSLWNRFLNDFSLEGFGFDVFFDWVGRLINPFYYPLAACMKTLSQFIQTVKDKLKGLFKCSIEFVLGSLPGLNLVAKLGPSLKDYYKEYKAMRAAKEWVEEENEAKSYCVKRVLWDQHHKDFRKKLGKAAFKAVKDAVMSLVPGAQVLSKLACGAVQGIASVITALTNLLARWKEIIIANGYLAASNPVQAVIEGPTALAAWVFLENKMRGEADDGTPQAKLEQVAKNILESSGLTVSHQGRDPARWIHGRRSLMPRS